MAMHPFNRKPTTILLRRKDLEERLGLSRSAIYARFRRDPSHPEAYDPSFPKPIKIGGRSVAWLESEIEEWIAKQIAKRA